MESTRLPKLDKKAFSIVPLTNAGDRDYWLTKSPHERLEAVETMRQILYGYNPLTTRLQRLFEVTQRA